MPMNRPLKIMVVNTKFLGDLIVSTPALRFLKEEYPSSELILIVRKEYRKAFENFPYIDRIIPFDTELKHKKGLRALKRGIDFILKLRKEKPDVFIALHPGDRLALWAYFSGAILRIAPKKQTFSFLLNKKIDVNEDSIKYIDYYNRIVEHGNKRVKSNTTEFCVPDEDVLWAEKFIDENGLEDGEFITVHPGASEKSKVWQLDNYIELIEKLLAECNKKILLLAGPQDEEYCNIISENFNEKNLVVYKSGSVTKSAALIKKSKLLIDNDTGTRHLGAALGVKILALLPEDNLDYWNFYDGVNHAFIVGKRIKDGEKSYLGGIDVETVFKKTVDLVGGKR
ncbi:lipopolysaccharide heptosyltransferase [Melioribacter roseus P3M-2]|uniref:Lipopolysaccharide heptosyltransferase n=1 Tax=Melioribacter roseus (strain DSM 23840 / JCM 17771 / VKM B-2668 / P3M-2) TaxID=1191523 RepID=I6YSR3_MELRP|nr:glycosyltransferase family 9 protein [Melioribacter roseus]AFN73592.1 lipopolysaccharide heptosyltransferase [Melioribacter roseus P3M-2]